METPNPMRDKQPLSQEVAKAYSLLISDSVTHIGRFTSKIPISPDRIYDIYRDVGNNKLFTHVTTDHPDPIRDSRELQSISGYYNFEDIIAPDSKDRHIRIVDNEEFAEEFFIKKGDTYHYLASTRYNDIQ